MTNREVNDFLASQGMAELRKEGRDAIRIIIATLEALGYDKDWLIELLEPRLAESIKDAE